MGVKEKRARYKQEFRRDILGAAREFFIHEGYEKFSMRRLAEKIDYSPTTIYLYFKNKDDLLFAICEEFFGHFSAQLNRIRTVLPRDPVETLRQALLYLMNFGLENPNQYKLIFFTKSVYGTREELVERGSMARNTYFAFKEMVQECINSGKLREVDVEVMVDTLVIASHGLIAKAIYGAAVPKDRSGIVALTLVDALLIGYRK